MKAVGRLASVGGDMFTFYSTHRFSRHQGMHIYGRVGISVSEATDLHTNETVDRIMYNDGGHIDLYYIMRTLF